MERKNECAKSFLVFMTAFLAAGARAVFADRSLPPRDFKGEVRGHETIIDGKHSYRPAVGYVPGEQTAIKIAEAVWPPIFGEEILKNEKPFAAERQFFTQETAGGPLTSGEKWYVHGTIPKNLEGGVAEIEIDKNSGQILRLSHGK